MTIYLQVYTSNKNYIYIQRNDTMQYYASQYTVGLYIHSRNKELPIKICLKLWFHVQ